MKHLIFVFFLSAWIISCGRKSDKEPELSSDARAFALQKELFFNSLKNPDDLADYLVPGLTGFDARLLNDPAYFFKYMGNDRTAAANLGIYLADLNYCVLFKQPVETKKYFDAAYELSKVMRIEKNILEFLMSRYQKNIEQNDSVKAVVNQLFTQSTAGLQGSDREQLAGFAMAGYQIENLYLIVSTIESLPPELTEEQRVAQKELWHFIFEYRGKFEVIYNFMRIHSDPLDPNKNPDYPFFDNALRELIGVFKNMSIEDPKISDLHEKVNALRTNIIRVK